MSVREPKNGGGAAGAGTRSTRKWRQVIRQERGHSAVELALILPVLLTIVFGVVDFTRLFYAYMTVASAAHEAAIYLAENITATDAELQSAAAAESPGPLGNSLTFTGASPNASLTKVTTLASGTTTGIVRVQVTYNFKPVTPWPLTGPLGVSVMAASPKTTPLT